MSRAKLCFRLLGFWRLWGLVRLLGLLWGFCEKALWGSCEAFLELCGAI